MFYLTTHSTHFIYGYMASDIWLRTILIVRKETHCRHIGYSPINSKGSFIYTIPDRIAHTTAFVTPVLEHWLEREIAQWVHPIKDRSDDPSHNERTLLPRSYISLPSKTDDQHHSKTRTVTETSLTKLSDFLVVVQQCCDEPVEEDTFPLEKVLLKLQYICYS